MQASADGELEAVAIGVLLVVTASAAPQVHAWTAATLETEAAADVAAPAEAAAVVAGTALEVAAIAVDAGTIVGSRLARAPEALSTAMAPV